MSTPLAAIDCGTNSVKLLIANFPEIVLRESRMVRLGQGVDTTGALADEALMRTFGALKEFREMIEYFEVPPDRIRFCATSATRDASNAAVFISGVERLLGVTPEVLSGPQEAALVYAGATRSLPTDLAEPVLVVDIGGGSTELVLGRAGAPVQSISLDIGAVRLTERHLHDDPPSLQQVQELVAAADAALATSGVDLGSARTIVGTSGTIKTVACGVLGLPAYLPDELDGARADIASTQDFIRRMVEMSVAQRRELPYMHPGRADVIGAGALIWSRILAAVQAGATDPATDTVTDPATDPATDPVTDPVTDYVVSESDILTGIAWSVAD